MEIGKGLLHRERIDLDRKLTLILGHPRQTISDVRAMNSSSGQSTRLARTIDSSSSTSESEKFGSADAAGLRSWPAEESGEAMEEVALEYEPFRPFMIQLIQGTCKTTGFNIFLILK